MRLTTEEFNELQRWIEVRDCCQRAKAELSRATDYANGHNYDSSEYIESCFFIQKLENKAVSKLREVLK